MEIIEDLEENNIVIANEINEVTEQNNIIIIEDAQLLNNMENNYNNHNNHNNCCSICKVIVLIIIYIDLYVFAIIGMSDTKKLYSKCYKNLWYYLLISLSVGTIIKIIVHTKKEGNIRKIYYLYLVVMISWFIIDNVINYCSQYRKKNILFFSCYFSFILDICFLLLSLLFDLLNKIKERK